MANEANFADQTRTKQEGFVYIARVANSRFVKIGYAKDVERRMRELQTAHAQPIKAIVIFPGDKATEGILHHRFRDQRAKGEWFRLCDELRIFIRRMGGPVLALDEWKREVSDDEVRAVLAGQTAAKGHAVFTHCVGPGQQRRTL